MVTLAPKLLVVEDDPAIRRLIQVAVERAGFTVQGVASAREALNLVNIVKPDLVLLDLGLPDRDGIELIQPLRARSDACLIVVSARDAIEEKVTALDLGADDYLSKPFDTEELLARVRTALRHRATRDGGRERWQKDGLTVDLVHRRVTRDGSRIHLTPKEFGVLAELSKHPDHVLGHRQLLQAVWGPAQESRVDYLRIVIRSLRQKVEPDAQTPSIIVTEVGVGYRLQI